MASVRDLQIHCFLALSARVTLRNRDGRGSSNMPGIPNSSKDTSRSVEPIRLEGKNSGQGEVGFPNQTLVEREGMQMVYFHKYNVGRHAYSIQNS